MNHKISLSFVFATLTAAAVVHAQAPMDEQQPQEPAQQPSEGSRAMSQATASKVTATVKQVDKAKRELTLQDEQGKLVMINVPEDVQRFDAIKPGDKLDITYYESVGLSIEKGKKGAKPKLEETTAVSRTPGEKPAGKAMRQFKAVGEVTAVDPAADTVTIKGPKGESHKIQVTDPALQAKLDTLKKGDMIEATYTQAIAIAVEPAQKKEG